MGWTRVADLEVEQASEPVAKCGLYARRGLDGVEVHIGDKVAKIPKQVLLSMVAEEYQLGMIRKYEGMSQEDLLGELRGGGV